MSRRVRQLIRRALGRGAPVPRPSVPATLIELERTGPAPLLRQRVPAEGRLRIATLIPSFRRGSGGHGTIVNLMRGMAERGHDVSLWLEDFELLHAGTPGDETRRSFAEFFAEEGLTLHTDFGHWRGADVVLATGWQTVPRALLLPQSGSRAYLVQDHEPEFYATSAEAVLAAATYRHGLHCIAASPWLAELLRTRYGASSSHFDLAVDHETYRPPTRPRREDLVVFYARSATPRRAVPLGVLALQELVSRRPDTRIALYGSDTPVYAPFPHTDLGILNPAGLAALYARAAIGMVFSLTNPSLTGLEMMASGLPCVELATDSVLASFGAEGPLRLAEPEPTAICSTIGALLDDGVQRAQLGGDGIAFMRNRTWDRAAEQLERGLRIALAEPC